MPRELSNPLTDDDKAWLRAWNREDEIPGEESQGVQENLRPGNPPGSTTPPAEDDPFNGEEPPEDYNEWTGDQLRKELETRGLPKSGTNATMVARLEEDDANREDGDEDEDEEDNG